MKIKNSPSRAPGAAPGGAAIASRLRLDVPTGPSAKNGTISKSAALVALIAGSVSLVLAGALTYMLYDHWDFIMSV